MPKVLVIDDSESIHRRVRQALVEGEVVDEIEVALEGMAGFKRLLSEDIDLVLCDVVMPGLDGFKLLSMIRQKPELADVPIIMLTGSEDVEAKLKGFSGGASDYVTKPFHDAELVARVRVHLQLKLLRDELRLKNHRLEELTRKDALTQVSNRRALIERLDIEWNRAQRYSSRFGVLMIDIDHFKSVNDTHGHTTGDHALIEVAKALTAAVRDHDLVSRYGGEEFAVLLAEVETIDAVRTAERCRRAIEGCEIRDNGGNLLKLTASIGVAVFPEVEARRAEELLSAADAALYVAKESGRNRVRAASPGPIIVPTS